MEHWSPEQVAGRLRRKGTLRISHETIYRYVWDDRRRGGSLFKNLRGAQKKRRKRYGRYDSRGRLAGKRPISARPPGAENRSRVGHLEGDTMIGSSDKHCILTLVDRKTGYLMIGKLEARTVQATNQRAIALIKNARRRVRTVSRLLAGHDVGLEEVDHGLFDVYFGPIWLGRFVEPKGLIFDSLGRGKRRTGGTYKGRRTVTQVS